MPQIRKRLFVIASKKSLSSPFPQATHTPMSEDGLSLHLIPTPTLWDAISDLPDIEAR